MSIKIRVAGDIADLKTSDGHRIMSVGPLVPRPERDDNAPTLRYVVKIDADGAASVPDLPGITVHGPDIGQGLIAAVEGWLAVADKFDEPIPAPSIRASPAGPFIDVQGRRVVAVVGQVDA
jgi:hypothetical protein